MISNIVCRVRGHRRSVSSARRIGGVWRSHCKRCGSQIVRVSPTKWQRMTKVDVLALRPELLRHLDQRYVMAEEGVEFRSAFFHHRDERALDAQDHQESLILRACKEMR